MATFNRDSSGQAQGNQPQRAQPPANQPPANQPPANQPQANQPQSTQPQATQPQRGEIMRRDPFQQLARDPFALLARDPFQLMRELMADPLRMFQMAPWGVGGVGSGSSSRDIGWNVGFDVRETDDAFLFKADLPGIRNEDVEITLMGNQLHITGKRDYEQEHDEGRMHTYERTHGSFARAFSLPESADLDNIRSDLKDGVLTLVVPKKASSSQRRKIQIGSGSKS
jgi:HSP20 family protein